MSRHEPPQYGMKRREVGVIRYSGECRICSGKLVTTDEAGEITEALLSCEGRIQARHSPQGRQSARAAMPRVHQAQEIGGLSLSCAPRSRAASAKTLRPADSWRVPFGTLGCRLARLRAQTVRATASVGRRLFVAVMNV